MHLDHAHDVPAVAIAELGEDLVVDRAELAAIPSICSGVRWAIGLSIVLMSGPSWLGHRTISIAPSGALTQVRTISPSVPWIAPLRRSRIRPEQS